MTPELEQRLQSIERQLAEHQHNGVDARRLDIADLFGFIKVVTVADQLTAILAAKPRDFRDMILIDTTTATKKLYIFNSVSGAWLSVTIS